MELNNARLATLKAAILAETDTQLVNRRNRRDTGLISDWYNADSTVIVWKSSVTKADVLERIKIEDLNALTAAQRDLLRIYLSAENVPCDRERVREAFAAIFASATQGTNTRLLALWKRAALRGEAVFATGGEGTDASPHRLVVEGKVTNENVIDALNA